jgi:DNA primase
MAGHFPETALDQILNRIDITELISGYIPLKRAGRNFKACCPFHHEKTPSFLVSPDKQIYHCFGCGAGGNAFNFLMQYERLDFPEAVRALAKKAGVDLPEPSPRDARSAGIVTQLYDVNESAARFYATVLLRPEGAQARKYLANRSIRKETAVLFGLGYAPDRWDALQKELRAGQFDLAQIHKAGLILAKDAGGYYDRFRGRIMFPIRDIKSRVIAFGAREIPAHAQGQGDSPKYINSPETPLYVKGRNLYGMDLAKDAIRQADCAVVVEGYLDMLIPYQEGMHNIVASLGTALTEEQIRLIKRFTRNVVMVYDADNAGQMATLRSLDLLLEEEMHVRVVSLPVGDDPDSFVRTQGVAAFQEKVTAAATLFEYKLALLKKQHPRHDAEAKAAISSSMLPTIARVKHAVLVSEYLKRLAQALDVKEEVLLQEIKKVKGDSRGPVEAVRGRVSGESIHPTEKLLMKLMLEEGRFINRIKADIHPDDFQDARVSRIVALLFELIDSGKHIEPKGILSQFDDEGVLRFVCESAFLPEISQEDKEKVVEDCIQRLKHRRLMSQRELLHKEIKKAQDLGDEERLQGLMREFHQLTKKR